MASKSAELSGLAEEKRALESSKKGRKSVSIEANVDQTDASTLTENHSQDEDRMKTLKEKLQQANAKLCETKNNCTHLRQELNKAQKVLRSELGESATTIASLLSSRGGSEGGGWRGRAQQILRLEQTVGELREKLGDRQSCQSLGSEQRNLVHLRNLEKERRRTIEERSLELGRAELALQKSEKQLQAARARIKILENDLNKARTTFTLLNEKIMHDDRLIEALNAQLGAVEEKYRERERLARNEKNKAEESCKDLKNELAGLKSQLDLLRLKLAERETEISNLRNRSEEPKRRGTADPAEVGSGPPNVNDPPAIHSPRDSQKTINSSPNEYVTLSLAAEAERQRLFELVGLLNGRVDKERAEVDRVTGLLRQERSKSAKLETKLQRLEMERVGIGAGRFEAGYSCRSRSFKSSVNLGSKREVGDPEKLRLRVELLEEECLTLKGRLATIERDKATDLEIYKKMLQQARATFQQAFSIYNPQPSTGVLRVQRRKLATATW
ncbi:coiled-coil domain-containing protein 13-like [Venturia canescens]|uniref:coiled-coil domain-containing protein 13-like n=1 Tax=Venturia canescens TaxID=32260 RepID=UPI001C9D179F|nr:coiled-coil domain-containing protein 13-like [Venturia canescens]